MRRQAVLVFAMVILVLAALQAPAAIIDSVNADKSPLFGIHTMGEVGWVYTPAFSYTLTGIQSKFSAGAPMPFGGYDIEYEIYDEPPGEGGILLRSATVNVKSWNTFVGCSFTPLELTTSEDYFVGFRNMGEPIGGLYGTPINFTFDGVSLPGYYGIDNSGTYSNAFSSDTYPILQFEGVPEPSTLLLLGLGAIALRKHRG